MITASELKLCFPKLFLLGFNEKKKKRKMTVGAGEVSSMHILLGFIHDSGRTTHRRRIKGLIAVVSSYVMLVPL